LEGKFYPNVKKGKNLAQKGRKALFPPKTREGFNQPTQAKFPTLVKASRFGPNKGPKFK